MKKIVEIKKDNKKNVIKKVFVNFITGIRAAGTIAIIPIFTNFGYFTAGLTAILFFLTDFIDGQLARRLHVQSFFGSLLDGLSDKAFGIVCLLLLSLENPMFLTIIASEIAILAVNYHSIQKGNNAKSSMQGKVKTCFLSAAIVGSLFAYGAPTLKEVLNFSKVGLLDKMLNINPNIITTCIAVPALASSLYVLYDYTKKSKEADKKREFEEEKRIKEIKKERKELVDRKEFLYRLFNTEYYLEHKDDSIKKLLYKRQ